MACGLSFEKDYDKFNEFRRRLNEYTKLLLSKTPFEPVLRIDGIMNDPTEEICREIEILQPTGVGNKNAIFGTDSLSIEEAKPIGDGTHIRFKLNKKLSAVGFGMTQLYAELSHPNPVKFAYTPSINIYSFTNDGGQQITCRNIQMLLEDFNSPEVKVNKDKTFLISSIKQNIMKRR